MENPIYDMDAQEYNLNLADALKKVPEFKAPEWINFVKSGSGKARPIEDEEFWYKRAASVLKNVYKRNSVGVEKLRTKYGSKKNRGFAPDKFNKASGKIIRTILQQADKAGFSEIQKSIKGVKSKRPGRILTEKGKKFLEEVK